MPATFAAHDRVEVPLPPDTVVGVTVQDRLVEFDDTARAVAAANPFSGVIVTVEVVAELAAAVTDIGLALMAKS